ncbi:MAG: hypothetical protein IPL61_36550 [Myxococcales bacterium]|nr:hypothetical protein [Myxococcales bacterium]
MSATSRFEVRRHEHHAGGLFELEITISWDVIDRQTGATVRSFTDESSARYDGVGWAGASGGCVVDVTLSADGAGVDVHRAGGAIEHVALDGP